MYPFLRMANEFRVIRDAVPLPLTGTHVSHHRCWPWDLDIWRELNNGRTLTLLDLGRLPLAHRVGLVATLRREGWAMTMAGVSVRYRRRVRMFDRIEMKSRFLGWDARFFYVEQGMWVRGQCANHALYRVAVTDGSGILPPARVAAAMGADVSPALPDWVDAWSSAEALRPWPPMEGM